MHSLLVQCLLLYALMVHKQNMSKLEKSSGLLFDSGSDLNVCYPVFPRDAQYAALPSVMCRIQSFC